MKWAALTTGLLLFLHPQQVIQVDVQLQQVTASVRDSAGHFVRGVNAGEIVIEENGVPQEIAHFEEQSAGPISLGIFADNCWEESSGLSSLKILDRPPEEQTRALTEFIGPQDEVSLMGCSNNLRDYSLKVLEDFTSERKRLERHLGSKYAVGILDRMRADLPRKTRFDTIGSALEKMQKGRNRKRALVLIMARPNVAGAEGPSFEKLLRTIAQYEIPVYVFRAYNSAGSGLIVGFLWDRAIDPTIPSAVQLAEATGGGLFQYAKSWPSPSTLLAAQAARDLEADLRSEYLIGYYSKLSAPSSGRSIRARTKSPDQRVFISRGLVPVPAAK